MILITTAIAEQCRIEHDLCSMLPEHLYRATANDLTRIELSRAHTSASFLKHFFLSLNGVMFYGALSLHRLLSDAVSRFEL